MSAGGDAMDQGELNERLSRISTRWTQVWDAHHGPEDAKAAAQRALLERYQAPMYRYLLVQVRDTDATEDLFNDFVVEFLKGGLRNADPQRGRFRDYAKAVLNHMVGRYRKGQRVQPQSLDPHTTDQAAPASEEPELDAEFISQWRRNLLDHAWRALEEWQQLNGQPYYAVLKFRSQHPDTSSAEMANQLTSEFKPDRPFTDTGIRKTLQRAREKFEDLLLDELACSLENPTLEQLEEELIDLRLLPYCRQALDRRRQD